MFRRLRRWSALPLLLLLGVVAGEPLRAHACAMHGMGIVATHGVHATPETTPAPAAAGAHDAHGAHAASHDDGTPAEHRCDCLGTCCAAFAVRLPALPVVPTAVAVLAEPGLPNRLGIAPATRPERLLPFAIGPPALA